jgi:glutathione peroxidase
VRPFIFTALVFLMIMGVPANLASASDQERIDPMTAYDFTFDKIDGSGPLPLSAYKGEVFMVVNTASRCGFTKQYDGLQKLYDGFKDQGFVVVGVPSNDFMGQEPGTNEEIKKFCETNFGITFPMTKKVSVKGKEAHPFFKWAASQPKGDVPGWNFHKYLIGKDGMLIESYGSSTRPDDSDLIAAIESALAAPKTP